VRRDSDTGSSTIEGGGNAVLDAFHGHPGRASSPRQQGKGATVDEDRVKGKAKETEGEIQQKWGEAKDKARDGWEDVKDKAEDLGDEAEDRLDERGERDEEHAEQGSR
jgi:uncharacterized protein YjbJ (UPF0337 family)